MFKFSLYFSTFFSLFLEESSLCFIEIFHRQTQLACAKAAALSLEHFVKEQRNIALDYLEVMQNEMTVQNLN